MGSLINEVEELQIGDDDTGTLFLSGGVLPHVKYPNAPSNARYYRSNGEVYINNGLASSDPWPLDQVASVDRCLPLVISTGVTKALKAVQGAIPIVKSDGTLSTLSLVDC